MALDVKGAQGRECIFQFRMKELEDRLRMLQVTEAMFAKGAEGGLVRGNLVPDSPRPV